MRILSIDVGIKNLAFCLFEIDSSTNYRIKHWDVIDLCNNIQHICCGQTKDKKCIKFSKFYKNDKYYCKIHAKKEKYKIPTRDMQKHKLEKALVKDLKKLCETLEIVCKKGKKIKKDYLEIIFKHLMIIILT